MANDNFYACTNKDSLMDNMLSLYENNKYNKTELVHFPHSSSKQSYNYNYTLIQFTVYTYQKSLHWYIKPETRTISKVYVVLINKFAYMVVALTLVKLKKAMKYYNKPICMLLQAKISHPTVK